ncbi:hypothetical protein FRIGORI9N_100006 [Frigoribacterium sp. 9N]|nr:hypothetical protein FRIGORI9N_100006 [Frigoribacterium sp. 9N]
MHLWITLGRTGEQRRTTLGRTVDHAVDNEILQFDYLPLTRDFSIPQSCGENCLNRGLRHPI